MCQRPNTSVHGLARTLPQRDTGIPLLWSLKPESPSILPSHPLSTHREAHPLLRWDMVPLRFRPAAPLASPMLLRSGILPLRDSVIISRRDAERPTRASPLNRRFRFQSRRDQSIRIGNGVSLYNVKREVSNKGPYNVYNRRRIVLEGSLDIRPVVSSPGARRNSLDEGSLSWRGASSSGPRFDAQ